MTNALQLASPTYRQGISREPLGAGVLDGPTATLIDALEWRVRKDANYCDYKYVSDDGSVSTLSIGLLDQRARTIAALLSEVCHTGDRVLLVYPPGLEFVSAFFGCLSAVVLIRIASLPRTTRGKVQRNLCRRQRRVGRKRWPTPSSSVC